MKLQESGDSKYLPVTSISSGHLEQVSTGVHLYTNQIVNVVFIEAPSGWVLVDTGMPKCGGEILSTAEKLFGRGARPEAVILTHGHFDHVGGIVHLLEQWAVPVHAHPLEFPFLTGKQSYPEPDTSVEGGLLAKLSALYPIKPVDISPALKPLPDEGMVPGLPEWRWLHVPGHSPGQTRGMAGGCLRVFHVPEAGSPRESSFPCAAGRDGPGSWMVVMPAPGNQQRCCPEPARRRFGNTSQRCRQLWTGVKRMQQAMAEDCGRLTPAPWEAVRLS